MHATWARQGSRPQISTKGERHTQKIFGAIRLDNAHFVYQHQAEYFRSKTYITFLEEVMLPAFYRRGHRVFLIQDNVSYHKKAETYQWFAQQRRYLEVFQLPPYWPELNAAERVWHYTRKQATHNRYFEQPQDLCRALFRTFRHVQRHPESIANLIRPFS